MTDVLFHRPARKRLVAGEARAGAAQAGRDRRDGRVARAICAWELDAAAVLRSGRPGLLPLLPFMQGSRAEDVRVASKLLLRGVRRRQERADLLAALQLCARNVFPDVEW